VGGRWLIFASGGVAACKITIVDFGANVWGKRRAGKRTLCSAQKLAVRSLVAAKIKLESGACATL